MANIAGSLRVLCLLAVSYLVSANRPVVVDQAILIKTPAEYERLKAGQIGVGYLAVFLEASIHPGIWDEIPNMLDSPHSQVRFYDENENEAILMLHEDRAVARVANGDNMLAKLPASYRTYDIRYESANATATATADLDAILSWKLARQISVKDHSDVAIDMMRRYKELRNLAMLHKLTLVVQRHSYKRLFVRQFLNHVSQLSEVEFVAGEGMTREALQEFVDQQEPPYAYEALLAGDRVIYKNAFY